MGFAWRVAVRFLVEGRMQTLFIVAAVAIGVAVIVFMSAMLSSLQANFLRRVLTTPFRIERRVIPDGFESVRDTIIDLVDNAGCDLVLTTGGTGPSARDLTPEATLAAAPREFPGFGEKMRQASLAQTPTAILSRQTAGSRGRSLIVNLPGKPRSIEVCLGAVFPAIPYALDLLGAGRIETNPAIVEAYRPA